MRRDGSQRKKCTAEGDRYVACEMLDFTSPFYCPELLRCGAMKRAHTGGKMIKQTAIKFLQITLQVKRK